MHYNGPTRSPSKHISPFVLLSYPILGRWPQGMRHASAPGQSATIVFFAHSPKRKKMVMSTLKKKMLGERFQVPKTRTLAYPGSNMQTDQLQLESSAMQRRSQINNKHAKRHTGKQLNPANIKNSTVESSESSKRQTKTDAFSARPSKLCTLR